MGKFSELDVIEKDLRDYATEVCHGDLKQAYKDDIKDIISELEQARQTLIRANDLVDLITANEDYVGYEVKKEDLEEELKELYKALAELKELI